LEVVKASTISVPIYRQIHVIPQGGAHGKIIYGPADANGEGEALGKYQGDIRKIISCEG